LDANITDIALADDGTVRNEILYLAKEDRNYEVGSIRRPEPTT
jgi:hypothetical protein